MSIPKGTISPKTGAKRSFPGNPFLHHARGECADTERHIFAGIFIGVGRMTLGVIAFDQAGIGPHMWTLDTADPAAVNHFRELRGRIVYHTTFLSS